MVLCQILAVIKSGLRLIRYVLRVNNNGWFADNSGIDFGIQPVRGWQRLVPGEYTQDE